MEPPFYLERDALWYVWNMPVGIGALLGSALGLLVVAVALWLGFRLLRRAYVGQAAIDRDEEQRRLDDKKRGIAAALRAEIKAASTAMRTFLAANPRVHITHEDGRDSVISGYPSPTTKLYDALLADIWRLGSDLCGELVDIYDMFERLRRSAATYRTMTPQNVEMVMNTHLESGVFTVYVTFLNDIQRRLGVIADGGEDPGPAVRVGRDPQTQRLRVIPMTPPAAETADPPLDTSPQSQA